MTWIKTSYILPPENERVLFYWKNEKSMEVGFYSKSEKGFVFDDNMSFLELKEVTHWQSLPEEPNDVD